MINTASDFISKLGATTKSIIKIALLSKTVRRVHADNTDKPMIILANGPSLRETIDSKFEILASHPLLCVNFAANAPEFFDLKPSYYVIADQHFYNALDDPNVKKLWQNLGNVNWPMLLFVDNRYRNKLRSKVQLPEYVKIETFNTVGAEGFASFEKIAYTTRLAMPRPRNVLIPAIMIGIQLGYKTIYICGADHSWMHDICVNENNEVVSGMNHFYKEDNKEIERSRNEYRGYKLHQIIKSFYTAFLSYHKIRRFADSKGVNIYNATPSSYIDAFERRPIDNLRAD